ncbi:alpha/beta hydrolase [Pontiellaceae bacterium B12219]|nr:alpha/beta hydrolase [Pontiellaceae bacterium B12219]
MFENPLIRSIVFAAVLYLLLNLIALFISDRILFQPQSPGYTRLPHQVRIPTTDGETLNAVYLKNPNAEFTLLFSHGNAEDLGSTLPFMQQFYDLGYSLLLYDYRGYGTSEGHPSYRKIKDDSSAAYRWLTEQQQIEPKTIIAHGRSLGGAVAIWIAAHHEVGGLIVESSFVSALRVKTVFSVFPWDKFKSAKLIHTVDCPVLIIHGTKDRLIPLWHGKKLYAAAPEPKARFWIEEGGHNNYAYVAEERYTETISAFIAENIKHADQPALVSTPK